MPPRPPPTRRPKNWPKSRGHRLARVRQAAGDRRSPTKSKTLNKIPRQGLHGAGLERPRHGPAEEPTSAWTSTTTSSRYVAIRTRNQALGKITAAAKARGAHLSRARSRPRRRSDRVASQMTLKGVKSPDAAPDVQRDHAARRHRALEHRDLDMNLVNAQQARRDARPARGLQGHYPFVWNTVKYGLSAGACKRGAAPHLRPRSAHPAFVPEGTGRSGWTTRRRPPKGALPRVSCASATTSSRTASCAARSPAHEAENQELRHARPHLGHRIKPARRARCRRSSQARCSGPRRTATATRPADDADRAEALRASRSRGKAASVSSHCMRTDSPRHLSNGRSPTFARGWAKGTATRTCRRSRTSAKRQEGRAGARDHPPSAIARTPNQVVS